MWWPAGILCQPTGAGWMRMATFTWRWERGSGSISTYGKAREERARGRWEWGAQMLRNLLYWFGLLVLAIWLGTSEAAQDSDWPSLVTWQPDARAIQSGLYIALRDQAK